MNNFSKFLHNKEGLIFSFRSIGRGYSIYTTIFLLTLVFFLLYPMWQYGRQGLGLWLTAVLFLLAILAKQLLVKDKLYLFTTKRLVLLEAINQNNYKIRGAISLYEIEKISAQGKQNIILLIKNKPYYLLNIEERDKIINKLKAYLQL